MLIVKVGVSSREFLVHLGHILGDRHMSCCRLLIERRRVDLGAIHSILHL
jgi:hypothetical protein